MIAWVDWSRYDMLLFCRCSGSFRPVYSLGVHSLMSFLLVIPFPFDSPPSHARASPDSHLLSLFPRSALRMPFLDDFSSCCVVIPVHSSLFIQRNHCHCFRGTIQQYSFVTLAVLTFSTCRHVEPLAIQFDYNSSYSMYTESTVCHPRANSRAHRIKTNKENAYST